MSSLVLPESFANGENASATEVTNNFTAIRDYVNSNAITKDGALAFTGFPDLPSGSPTGANNATHKAYVDGADANRLATSVPNLKLRSGSATGTSDGSGALTVSISPALTATNQVIVTPTTTTTAVLRVTNKTGSTFTITTTASTAVTFDWIAIGS